MDISRGRTRVNRMFDLTPTEASRDYDRVMGVMARQYDDAAQTIARRVPSAESVLDVGTGPGYLPPKLAARYPDARITGLDLGPEMVAIAGRRAQEEGVSDRVAYVVGSAYEMPFTDASFDLVVATNAIHMFDELPAFLSEARRVLTPGGSLVIVDYRRDVSLPVYAVMWGSTLTLRIMRKSVNGMGPVIDASYTKDEIEAAVAAAGYGRCDVSTRAVRLEAWAQA